MAKRMTTEEQFALWLGRLLRASRKVDKLAAKLRRERKRRSKPVEIQGPTKPWTDAEHDLARAILDSPLRTLTNAREWKE